MNPGMKKTLLASSITLTLAVTNAEAAPVLNVLGYPDPNYGTAEQSFMGWYTDSANFTLLAPNGGVVGSGANDITMLWDGNAYNSSTDYTGPGGATNVTLSTTAPFFAYPWTAHDIQMFTPGSYSFDTTLGSGNPEAGTLSATVGTGQLGMHMLWDWNGNFNIDVFVVFAQNSIFGSGLLYSTQTNTKGQFTCDSNFTGTIVQNCLDDSSPYFGSAGAPTMNQLWTLASSDPDGDGIMGIPTALGGPTEGYNYNFNANLTPVVETIPIPAAVWLFGSGLLGLAGVARRKKKTA